MLRGGEVALLLDWQYSNHDRFFYRRDAEMRGEEESKRKVSLPNLFSAYLCSNSAVKEPNSAGAFEVNHRCLTSTA
jgi:hypothetical protein